MMEFLNYDCWHIERRFPFLFAVDPLTDMHFVGLRLLGSESASGEGSGVRMGLIKPILGQMPHVRALDMLQLDEMDCRLHCVTAFCMIKETQVLRTNPRTCATLQALRTVRYSGTYIDVLVEMGQPSPVYLYHRLDVT